MLKQLLPNRLKDAVKVFLGQARAVAMEAGGKFCPVCRQSTEFQPMPYSFLRKFIDAGYVYPLFDGETMNWDEYSCRHCGASDRERLFALYLNQFWRGPGKILEIAPRAAFTTFIRQLHSAEVRTADLFDPTADDKVDLTDMSLYASNQFDAWICSHVLEHIPDDRAAMRELYRVLKPGCWGIALVPICLSVQQTHEDPSITDPIERWKYFGQDDHVRMYAKQDFVDRLTSVGFDVEQFSAGTLGADVCMRHGIDPRSVLYIARKPASNRRSPTGN